MIGQLNINQGTSKNFIFISEMNFKVTLALQALIIGLANAGDMGIPLGGVAGAAVATVVGTPMLPLVVTGMAIPAAFRYVECKTYKDKATCETKGYCLWLERCQYNPSLVARGGPDSNSPDTIPNNPPVVPDPSPTYQNPPPPPPNNVPFRNPEQGTPTYPPPVLSKKCKENTSQ
jgi:hypothetical protein